LHFLGIFRAFSAHVSTQAMLNQVSKALSLLFKPVATSKSDADRDPGGNQFERFQSPEQKPQDEGQKPAEKQVQAEPAIQPMGNVIQFPNLEAQKKAIGISQAWLDIKSGLKDLIHAKAPSQGEGPGRYNEASTQASPTQLSKKGAILDKKAS
jgi:hypothetical protein